jgi:hypothetical protein
MRTSAGHQGQVVLLVPVLITLDNTRSKTSETAVQRDRYQLQYTVYYSTVRTIRDSSNCVSGRQAHPHVQTTNQIWTAP